LKGLKLLAHYFTDNRNLEENRKEHSFRFSGHLYTFITDNGVFSKTEVDRGTEILLDACMNEPLSGRVLDLGCGYGVVSVILGTEFPSLELTAVDINPRAVELTELNCGKNGVRSTAFVSDGFAQIRDMFSHVITNPPIRAGKKVIYGMLEDSFAHLEKGGTLLAVIRRKQGAESALKKMEEIFGNCETVSREKGYWVLKSTKLTD
jgi:16S rRNA (guanine1207-N2)-methyltransferase